MNQCVIPNRTARTLLLAAVLLLMLLVNAGGASSPDAEPSTRVIELVNRGVGRMGQYQYGQAVEAFKAETSHITEITRGIDEGDQVYYHSFITWEEHLRRGVAGKDKDKDKGKDKD